MQIVIDIPEEIYNMSRIAIVHPLAETNIPLAVICNGTPLPKGHGRLIDESDLIPDSDYEDGTFYAVSIGQIKRASTIIEADKAESEDKE